MKKKRTFSPRTLRLSSGLTQQKFWAALGVTQSGGCRYEQGRSVPKPVQMLIALRHCTHREALRALKLLRA